MNDMAATMAHRPDLQVQDHGSIFLLCPQTEDGEQWIDEHLPEDAMRWAGNSVVVEHRFIKAIVMGAIADGLTVE